MPVLERTKDVHVSSFMGEQYEAAEVAGCQVVVGVRMQLLAISMFARISVSDHGDSFGEDVQVLMLHGENPVVRLRLWESGKLCRSMLTI